MKATRDAWAAAVLAGGLAVMAAVLARPLLLAGPVGLGAWLLARQARFVRAAARTADDLSVTQEPTRAVAVAGDTVTVTLTAALPSPTEAPLTIEASPPVGTQASDTDERTVTIPRGEQSATTTFVIECPVAGRHTFDPATVTLEDPAGLFESHHRIGTTPTLTVEPRRPREIHVGEGGEQVAGAFGEHATGQTGAGLVPEELREYVPGDPADTIDWKATARLQEPHVRQFDVETDLRTALVLDTRAPMADGRPGRTKLDYARQVALSYLAGLREADEAVGLYAVDDEGLVVREPPATGEAQYGRLRLRLHDLTTGEQDERTTPLPRPPGEARRWAHRLGDDDSPFATALRPFLADREHYVQRIDADPLYAAVRSQVRTLQGPVVTVIVSDDSHRAELREAVELASRGDDRVVAFILPSVLYEPGGLGDLEAVYERYADFEDFRRNLARHAGVTAFEVAPRDRIEALLAAHRRRSSA